MKTRSITAVLMASAVTLSAQSTEGAEQENLLRLRNEKLAEAWVGGGHWLTDYDLARKQAAAQGKVIFAYFTRSYSP